MVINNKQKQQKIEVVETKNLEIMFTVKVIGVNDKDSRQRHTLLGGSEVNYEIENYKRNEFGKVIRKLLGEGDNFTYIGLNVPDEKRKDVCTLLYLNLFKNGEWEQYIIQDGWVYIMHNGKTIDKYDLINN